MNRVRIFISSPSDVAAERNIAKAVVDNLQAEFAETLLLDVLLWEHEPLLASADFQSQIHSPADFDVFATIVGSRLGSPLGDDYKRPDGSRYASGTEFEFEAALNSFHAKGSPELLVYRKRPPAAPESDQIADAVATQAEVVDRFFDHWFMDSATHTATGAYHWFEQPHQFEQVFTLHLRKLIRRSLPRPNNIPAPISTFVGRRQLLTDLKAQLHDASTRLLTLVGAGGTGKSRVALRIAKEVLPDFDDGVFFIPLATLRDAALIPGAIVAATALARDVQGNGRDPVASLIEQLRHKTMLLVLDNLEQIPAAGGLLNTLVSSCPNLKILATSRALLPITGAKAMVVAPYAIPPLQKMTLGQARELDAVALFMSRAQSARPDFDLSEENFRDVVEICSRLDGLPLAIELATSRLRSMDIGRLLKAMDKRFSLLKGGPEDLLDHQKSLRGLVTWSYELLTEEQQKLWRRMAVFGGSFDMDAAEQVCDPDDSFVVDVEIEDLANHSLATISFGQGPRIHMLGTLREFALEQLKEVGEYDLFQDRLVAWACEQSAEVHVAVVQRRTDGMLKWMDLEHDNLLAAIDYCRQHNDNRALTIAGNLWYYWFERGHMDVARDLLGAALGGGSADPSTRARALKGLGSIARFQRELTAATEYCESALAIYQELEDPSGQSGALGELGAIEISTGNLDKAARYLDQAIQIRQTIDPNDGHFSFLLATRGVVHHLHGQLDDAKIHYQRALETASVGGDSDSRASALVNLGEIAEAEGDLQAAYQHYHDSLALFHQRGKKVAIAYCAEVLAGLSVRHLNQPEHSALLFGFTASLRTEISTPIEPFNEQRLQDDVALTRETLGEQEFNARWKDGEGLHLEDFLSYMEHRG